MAGSIERQTADGHPSATNLPRFSLVIPAFNEEVLLPRLLDSVDRARVLYAGGPDSIEVVVADDGSTDATLDIALERGCRTIAAGARRIAGARNAGAGAARGDILAFVDADSQMHPDTFDEIDRVMAGGRVIGGTTGAVFERRSAGLLCTHAGLALLGIAFRGWRAVRRPGMDIGVVFCGREDFEAIGGYRERYRWGEDVWLLFDLLRRGWRSGRSVEGGTGAPAIVSTRKFDRYGDWHYFTMPVRILWDAIRRRDTTARRYWYEQR